MWGNQIIEMKNIIWKINKYLGETCIYTKITLYKSLGNQTYKYRIIK